MKCVAVKFGNDCECLPCKMGGKAVTLVDGLVGHLPPLSSSGFRIHNIDIKLVVESLFALIGHLEAPVPVSAFLRTRF